MNTMIILQNASNKGKTSVLAHLANYLQNNSSNPNFIEGEFQLPDYAKDDYRINNFLFICTINSIKIGIVSMGDNYSLKNKLTLINNHNIDILFGACRSRGITLKIMKETATQNKSHLIFTSTYKTNLKDKRENLNKIKADELFELLNKLKLI